MTRFSKAIAAVVGALAAVLVTFNIDISEELQGAIIVVASAVATALAPANAE